MTYGWSIRAAAFELDTNSPAHGNVKFIPHPHGPARARCVAYRRVLTGDAFGPK